MGRQSGIAHGLQLRPHVPRWTAELYEAGEAIYKKYASWDALELWLAVLLRSRVEVDRLGYDGFQAVLQRNSHLRRAFRTMFTHGKPLPEPTPEEVLCLNAQRALDALRCGELEPHLQIRFPQSHTYTTLVEPEVFEAWAVKAELPILGSWRRLTDPAGWPIGAAVCFPARTEELERLSVLARELHGKPWPGNAQVIARGVALGFTKHLAEVAATFLRPDDAPSGRPPRVKA